MTKSSCPGSSPGPIMLNYLALALEAAYTDIVTDIVTDDLPEWNQDPRTTQLAHHTVSLHARQELCAALDPQRRSHQAQRADAAHNPALLIRVRGITGVG